MVNDVLEVSTLKQKQKIFLLCGILMSACQYGSKKLQKIKVKILPQKSSFFRAKTETSTLRKMRYLPHFVTFIQHCNPAARTYVQAAVFSIYEKNYENVTKNQACFRNEIHKINNKC